jgi:tyrosinase
VDGGKDLNYTNPDPHTYTTIGDMAKKVSCNGYIYAPPASPDIWTPPRVDLPSSASSGGGNPLALVQSTPPVANGTSSAFNIGDERKAYILFQDVVCTTKSYEIDVYLQDAQSKSPDHVNNPDYIGRLFRFGMGVPPTASTDPNTSTKFTARCQKRTVTRLVDVPAQALESTIKNGFIQVVTEL